LQLATCHRVASVTVIAANVLVIAIGIAILRDTSVLHLRGIPDVAAAIIVYGGVPGLLAGAISVGSARSSRRARDNCVCSC
jgi:hypothetical protein